jgi:hypothetical protein
VRGFECDASIGTRHAAVQTPLSTTQTPFATEFLSISKMTSQMPLEMNDLPASFVMVFHKNHEAYEISRLEETLYVPSPYDKYTIAQWLEASDETVQNPVVCNLLTNFGDDTVESEVHKCTMLKVLHSSEDGKNLVKVIGSWRAQTRLSIENLLKTIPRANIVGTRMKIPQLTDVSFKLYR